MIVNDAPEDQQYIWNEFQRAKALMYKLSERQQKASLRKMELEKDIMSKGGVDDAQQWNELRQVRVGIDSMAQEKLLLIAKLYNLSQKFV